MYISPKFLSQTDLRNTVGPGKAIVRKTNRQIDQHIAWRVYERDEYRCRYCGNKAPLTVDHIDLWEDGGATMEQNLVASCRRCNKLRGRTPYGIWIGSADYAQVSGSLDPKVRQANQDLVQQLPRLQAQRVATVRSR